MTNREFYHAKIEPLLNEARDLAAERDMPFLAILQTDGSYVEHAVPTMLTTYQEETALMYVMHALVTLQDWEMIHGIAALILFAHPESAPMLAYADVFKEHWERMGQAANCGGLRSSGVKFEVPVDARVEVPNIDPNLN